MRRRPLQTRSDWPAIIGLAVAAIGLTVWHHQARGARPPRVSLPERAVRAVLFPVQTAITWSWQETSLTVSGLLRGKQLARELERVREERDALEAWRIQRLEEHHAYQEMRLKLGFDKDRPIDYIPAEVVGRSGGRFMRQTVDIVAGGDRSIPKGATVRTEKGLVGRVMTSPGGRTTVMLLVDPSAGAAAVVPSTGATGVVMGPDPAGADPDLLRLQYLRVDDVVEVGDKVYTSPIGDLYPPGIPIGVIEEIVGGSGQRELKVALVRPYADFDNLNYVKVEPWEK